MQYPAGIVSQPDEKQTAEIQAAIQGCYDGMNDDLNTAVTIAHLFTLLKKINQLYTGGLSFDLISEATFDALKSTYVTMLEEVLGIRLELPENWESLTEGLLSLYKGFKEARKYDKVDEIRATFKSMGLLIKDMKDSIDWGFEE